MKTKIYEYLLKIINSIMYYVIFLEKMDDVYNDALPTSIIDNQEYVQTSKNFYN